MIRETIRGLIEMEIDWICSFCEERTQHDDDENRSFESFLTPPHTALCAFLSVSLTKRDQTTTVLLKPIT
jgi:hypothetical protein